jgi:hypothetical protein
MHWSDCRFSFDFFKYLACRFPENDDVTSSIPDTRSSINSSDCCVTVIRDAVPVTTRCLQSTVIWVSSFWSNTLSVLLYHCMKHTHTHTHTKLTILILSVTYMYLLFPLFMNTWTTWTRIISFIFWWTVHTHVVCVPLAPATIHHSGLTRRQKILKSSLQNLGKVFQNPKSNLIRKSTNYSRRKYGTRDLSCHRKELSEIARSKIALAAAKEQTRAKELPRAANQQQEAHRWICRRRQATDPDYRKKADIAVVPSHMTLYYPCKIHCERHQSQKFQLFTDNSVLTWILSFKNLKRQRTRWVQRLQEYFTPEYHKRYKETNAHAL